jgi:hypothetical protein|nr:MAG TPA: hypothetical protein [Caudoviricetes sp.]
MLKKSKNPEEYEIQCKKLKEDIILYINRVLRRNAWRMKYSEDRYVMISNIYNITHRLLCDFKDGWYFYLDNTDFTEVSEGLLYFKSRIPLDNDIKTFINIVILYYFKCGEGDHFLEVYNKVFKAMCDFADEVEFG